MHAIWKGHISFGLVHIPVTLYPAENRTEKISFRMLDRRNKAPVHYQRVNESTGKEVPWEDVVKGYEYEKGEYVLVDDAELEKAAVEATQAVEIEDFVDRNSIQILYYDKPYYLVPDPKAVKSYVLLRETLARSGKVGIARVVIRTRQYLSALAVDGNALILELLRFPEELRDTSEFSLPHGDLKEYGISKSELDMAARLVETMATEWQPEKYHDTYQETLRTWIEEKAKKGAMATPPEPGKAKEREARVVDVMDLLRRSLEDREKQKPKPAAAKKPPAHRKRAA